MLAWESHKAPDRCEESTRACLRSSEVVKKLLGRKLLDVDEIRSQTLKALEIAGLSWLTCHLGGGDMTIFAKGDRRGLL